MTKNGAKTGGMDRSNRAAEYVRAMTALTNDEAVSRYRKDGFCFPLRAYAPAEAADCRAKLEAWEASQDSGRLEGGMKQKLHVMLTWVADIPAEAS